MYALTRNWVKVIEGLPANRLYFAPPFFPFSPKGLITSVISVIAAFDIFRVINGQPLWVDAVQTLEIAKASVRQLMTVRPAEYFILDQTTHHKIALKPGDHTWSSVPADPTPL